MDFSFVAHKIASCMRAGTRRDTASKYGFKYIAGGSYGSTYLHEASGKVLKVSYSLADGSMGFIALCAQHFAKYGKPPQDCVIVYEFGKRKTYWYAVMERVHVGDVDVERWSDVNGEESSLVNQLVDTLYDWIGGANLRVGFYRARRKPHGPHDVLDDISPSNIGVSTDGTDRLCLFDPFASCTHIKNFPKAVKPKRVYGPQPRKGARYAV